MIAGGPTAADFRREAAARRLAQLADRRRRYDASAGVGFDVADRGRKYRRFSYVAGSDASADRHLASYTLARLRELCRAHDRNSALLSGILNRAIDNIFGPTLTLRPATGEPALDRLASAYLAGRAESADATGARDLADLARTALRAVWTDGDCLLAKRRDGSLLPFEADQIESPSGRDDLRIILGVELDDLNRRRAFWLRQRRTTGSASGSARSAPAARLPAADALYLAHLPRFGQTRGLPFLAPALCLFERLDGYLDNETLAAEVNSTAGWSITQAAPTESDLDGVADNTDGDTSGSFEKTQQFEPGWVWAGIPGEKIEMVGATRPGETFEPYVILVARIVGAAVGFPLELLLLDFSKTTYSSARASLMEARRSFRYWQDFIERRLCRPWHRWQIDRAIAAGDLPARPELYRYRTQWPAWAYVDPLKEAEANQVQLANATKSISECIREQGRDPLDTFDEIAADNRELAARGIRTQVVPLTADNVPGARRDEEEEEARTR